MQLIALIVVVLVFKEIRKFFIFVIPSDGRQNTHCPVKFEVQINNKYVWVFFFFVYDT